MIEFILKYVDTPSDPKVFWMGIDPFDKDAWTADAGEAKAFSSEDAARAAWSEWEHRGTVSPTDILSIGRRVWDIVTSDGNGGWNALSTEIPDADRSSYVGLPSKEEALALIPSCFAAHKHALLVERTTDKPLAETDFSVQARIFKEQAPTAEEPADPPHPYDLDITGEIYAWPEDDISGLTREPGESSCPDDCRCDANHGVLTHVIARGVERLHSGSCSRLSAAQRELIEAQDDHQSTYDFAPGFVVRWDSGRKYPGIRVYATAAWSP
jgi:hypothetical protein